MKCPPVICLLVSAALLGACAGKVGPDVPDGSGAGEAVEGVSATEGHNYCPGAQHPPDGSVTCLDYRDCPTPPHLFQALCISALHPRGQHCGGGAIMPPQCQDDSGCPAGEICRIAQCERFNSCEPGCTPQSCGSGADCANGHCVRKRCDQPGGACDADWTCRPGPDTAATYGCVPDSCRDRYRCSMPFDCNPGAKGADPHGCAPRPCRTFADCACGSCIQGTCEVAPGVCELEPPPPP